MSTPTPEELLLQYIETLDRLTPLLEDSLADSTAGVQATIAYIRGAAAVVERQIAKLDPATCDEEAAAILAGMLDRAQTVGTTIADWIDERDAEAELEGLEDEED